MAKWAKLLPQLHDRSIRNPVVAQFWPMSAKAAKPVEETPDDIADISDLVGTDDDFSFVGTPQEPTRQNKKNRK